MIPRVIPAPQSSVKGKNVQKSKAKTAKLTVSIIRCEGSNDSRVLSIAQT